MKRLAIGCALAASLTLPGIASAADRHEVREAARECRAEREALGAEQFRVEHRSIGHCIRATVRENRAQRRQAVRDCREQGLRGRAFARCVRGEQAEQRVEEGEARNAARECRAEREEMGEDNFRDHYGTNRNNRNAFGKCVSSKVAENDADEGQDAPAAQGEGRPDGAGRPEGAGPPA